MRTFSPTQKLEWKQHLGVINDSDWKESEKAFIRGEIKKIIETQGKVPIQYLSPQYQWNWVAARLRDGDFSNWEGFQYRSDWAVTFRGINGFETKVPKWDGSPVNHLVVLGEQGMGDEILFFSALPELMVRLGTNAIEVQCYPELRGIVERSFKVRTSDRKILGEINEGDAVVALGDLFPFYRRDKSHFPRKPYLKPDPVKVEKWRKYLNEFGNRQKIGIGWYSRHGYVDPKSLCTVKDAVYFDLQYDFEEKASLQGTFDGIRPPFDNRRDFENLFAFVYALDSVHSVTQTLVHIAGAVGKECKAVIPPKNGEVSWFLWYHACKALGNGKHWPHLIYPSVTIYEDINEFRHHSRPG